jgi:hypothetical protein
VISRSTVEPAKPGYTWEHGILIDGGEIDPSTVMSSVILVVSSDIHGPSNPPFRAEW